MIDQLRPEPSLKMLFRHQRKIAIAFCVVMFVAVVAAVFLPKRYRSVGKLLVRLGRDNVAVDPTATAGATPIMTMQPSYENEINSAIEIFGSQVVAEKVADALGPGVIFGYADLQPTTNVKTESDSGAAGDQASTPDQSSLPRAAESTSLREAAIRWLSKSLHVEAIHKSNVLEVTCDAKTPELSQAIVSQAMQCFLQENIRLHRTPGAETFLSEQTSTILNSLKQHEDQWRQAKEETGLTDPQQQRALLISRINSLQDELLQTKAAQAATGAELEQLRQQLSSLSTDEITTRTVGFTNEGTDGIRQQLYSLQLHEKELASRLTADNPQLQQIRQQLAEARSVYEKEVPDRTQTTTQKSKTYEELNLLILKDEASLAALQAKAERIEKLAATEREGLSKLNKDELVVGGLQRQIRLDEDQYEKYTSSLEQARIDAALAFEGKSNISLVQPATLDHKASWPNGLLVLALGFVAACLASVGVAFLSEFLDESGKSAQELENPAKASRADIPRFEFQPACAPNGGVTA